jgi:threonine/homoserine/homoserine lactone efflux protein
MLEIAGVHLLPDAPRFLAFVAAGLALNIVPGADMAFVVTSAARRGVRGGVAATLGIGSGALVHVAAAVVGLSALIASSQTAFSVLKLIGAAYLLYIAVQILRGGAAAFEPPTSPVTGSSYLPIFRTGMLVNVLNPKVGLFFLAFLPQFVDPAAEIPAVQIFALGFWVILTGIVVHVAIAAASAKATASVRRIGWVARAARWVAATTMAALAVRLVAEQRS